jgi:plastocyanin
VRRATAGLICLGLVSVSAVVLGAVSMAHAAPAPREGCTWHRHSKRVITHRRRHGQVRSVKRTRHWWTCDPRPAAPAPDPLLPVFPIAEPPLDESESTVSHLSVKAVEWSYTLSRPEVTAGEVIVELDNQGEDSHNLKIQREGSGEPPLAVPEAAAAQRTTARLNLPPGTYHLYCSLFQHDEKGMHATLVVGGD